MCSNLKGTVCSPIKALDVYEVLRKESENLDELQLIRNS
uniref:Uncharacterized protein n=1 Tax=Glossina morsitans morsitans TaxID=37546 RepID=A0ABK9NG73_GLOMM